MFHRRRKKEEKKFKLFKWELQACFTTAKEAEWSKVMAVTVNVTICGEGNTDDNKELNGVWK